MGWGALGCSSLTAFGPSMNGRRRVARDVTWPKARRDGSRSSTVAARGCRASRGGGGWPEQQVIER
ncbi:hypothetical protein DEO72_LG3g1960 [Vigna unguiculata]|uniref:Uncharacterized protein n=1 Tax=Vigna unguiculata TaxID=3917 RepID=A0A4D6LH00_VIGUN|nr:hypothetical protein DEO72_LG3g1960 [Vigna unguiculata]